jgi:hypothetical protein
LSDTVRSKRLIDASDAAKQAMQNNGIEMPGSGAGDHSTA